ncbi:potassium channel protein [Heliobacterium gestii]|uniref:Potassium channel protein n=1 Tax=Heliomicrobium gestii TaxID=2699 RepID=A0A845LGW5_HELGE|nr:potassium channel protein [Heliomicrobium gestii]MBM7867273.1 voltage-gated potassium channel [Heliomicrobium gestii]MZP43829.1 potassium channel protein [Heliomicrobium gestii]
MESRQIKWATLSIVGFLVFGTVGILFFEKEFGVLDAAWLTETTLLTVGYGDRLPKTTAGQIFLLAIMPLGVGIVAYAIGIIAGSVVEGRLANLWGRRAMKNKIAKLDNHIIVCGAGRVGWQVAEQLSRENVPFVVVDSREEVLEKYVYGKFLYVMGDALDDDVLREAGIERARGVVAALPTDADNVFITLTAKGIKSDILVVARADRLESEGKLRRAGADKVVSPAVIGGKRMALSILKPVSVDYVDTVLHDREFEFSMEELVLEAISPLIGKTLAEARIREETGAMVVAIYRGRQLISNPQGTERLENQDMVILFGTREQLLAFERLAAAKPS